MIDWAKVVQEQGYVWNIGQLSREDIRALDRLVKQGKITKTKALWPRYFWGTCTKTIWLKKFNGVYDAI